MTKKDLLNTIINYGIKTTNKCEIEGTIYDAEGKVWCKHRFEEEEINMLVQALTNPGLKAQSEAEKRLEEVIAQCKMRVALLEEEADGNDSSCEKAECKAVKSTYNSIINLLEN